MTDFSDEFYFFLSQINQKNNEKKEAISRLVDSEPKKADIVAVLEALQQQRNAVYYAIKHLPPKLTSDVTQIQGSLEDLNRLLQLQESAFDKALQFFDSRPLDSRRVVSEFIAHANNYANLEQGHIRRATSIVSAIAAVAAAVGLPSSAHAAAKATRPAPQSQAILQYQAQSVQELRKDTADILIARCLFGEARGEGNADMVAIAWTIKNRLADPGHRWGTTYFDVICKGQYSCFLRLDKNRDEVLNPLGSGQAQIFTDICLPIARRVLQSTIDPTGGATHYLEYRQLLENRKVPPWAYQGRMRLIGNIRIDNEPTTHVFFYEPPFLLSKQEVMRLAMLMQNRIPELKGETTRFGFTQRQWSFFASKKAKKLAKVRITDDVLLVAMQNAWIAGRCELLPQDKALIQLERTLRYGPVWAISLMQLDLQMPKGLIGGEFGPLTLGHLIGNTNKIGNTKIKANP